MPRRPLDFLYHYFLSGLDHTEMCSLTWTIMATARLFCFEDRTEPFAAPRREARSRSDLMDRRCNILDVLSIHFLSSAQFPLLALFMKLTACYGDAPRREQVDVELRPQHLYLGRRQIRIRKHADLGCAASEDNTMLKGIDATAYLLDDLLPRTGSPKPMKLIQKHDSHRLDPATDHL